MRERWITQMQTNGIEQKRILLVVRKIKNTMLCIQICGTEVATPAQINYCFVPVMFLRSEPSTQVRHFVRAHSDRVSPIPMQGAVIYDTGMTSSALQFCVTIRSSLLHLSSLSLTSSHALLGPLVSHCIIIIKINRRLISTLNTPNSSPTQ